MKKHIQKIYQYLLFFVTMAVLAINGASGGVAGEIVSQATGEITPQATGGITPQGVGEITPRATGEIIPQATGRIVPQATGEIFPDWFRKPDLLPDTDIWTLFENITRFLMTIAIPLATIFYIWAAFLYLTSGGNEKRIKAAHQTVLYTTIGLAVIISADALAAIVKDVLSPLV